MKTYLFTKCWAGCYVGGGEVVGGRCPDLLITNVPDNTDDDFIFEMYLKGLQDGFSNNDEIRYQSKIVKRRPRSKTPIKLNSLKELIYCEEDYVELDYNDLEEWIYG